MLLKTLTLILLVLTPAIYSQPADTQNFEEIAREPGAVIFNPPKNWQIADEKQLPDHVRFMVVGKGKHEFPPSINLSTEEFNGSLQDYLAIVKKINASQGAEWKNLGTIKTEAGDASLSQADALTEWGPVRMMHVILLKNGTIYILTAAALKKEFPSLYQTFFKSLKSLKVNDIQ